MGRSKKPIAYKGGIGETETETWYYEVSETNPMKDMFYIPIQDVEIPKQDMVDPRPPTKEISIPQQMKNINRARMKSKKTEREFDTSLLDGLSDFKATANAYHKEITKCEEELKSIQCRMAKKRSSASTRSTGRPKGRKSNARKPKAGKATKGRRKTKYRRLVVMERLLDEIKMANLRHLLKQAEQRN